MSVWNVMLCDARKGASRLLFSDYENGRRECLCCADMRDEVCERMWISDKIIGNLLQSFGSNQFSRVNVRFSCRPVRNSPQNSMFLFQI